MLDIIYFQYVTLGSSGTTQKVNQWTWNIEQKWLVGCNKMTLKRLKSIVSRTKYLLRGKAQSKDENRDEAISKSTKLRFTIKNARQYSNNTIRQALNRRIRAIPACSLTATLLRGWASFSDDGSATHSDDIIILDSMFNANNALKKFSPRLRFRMSKTAVASRKKTQTSNQSTWSIFIQP